jgi:hypothetical protein
MFPLSWFFGVITNSMSAPNDALPHWLERIQLWSRSTNLNLLKSPFGDIIPALP